MVWSTPSCGNSARAHRGPSHELVELRKFKGGSCLCVGAVAPPGTPCTVCSGGLGVPACCFPGSSCCSPSSGVRLFGNPDGRSRPNDLVRLPAFPCADLTTLLPSAGTIW